MVGKLDPEERVLPDFFKETSQEPYIKHSYKLVYKNKNHKVFDNYFDLFETWAKTPKELMDYVVIIDNKEKKTRGNGFK